MTIPPTFYMQQDIQPAVVAMPQSGLGVVSFVIAVIIGLLELGLVVFARVAEATTPGGIDEESAMAIIASLVLMGGLMLNLVGAGLGLAGLVQVGRRKLFAVLGVTFNVAILLGMGFLIMVGIAATV